MIEAGLIGVEFVVANTDAQALTSSKAERIIQMGLTVTQGLGAGSQPEVGRAAADEVIDEIRDQLSGAHMVFVTAGMGGGTGTGAAPVIARAARDMGILTVGVVTKPFQFEGVRRMRVAESGVEELQQAVDTLIVIPNQNLFRIANEKTTFADAFAMADQVLYSGVACITDLMVKEGLINLDFADVRAIMRGMGKAMMGTGEASGEKRANRAAEAAIANPLLDDVSMKGARGLLISITGGRDLTLYEVDEAATRIREEVDQDANIILGATFDEALEGIIRVSVVATGIDHALLAKAPEIAATEQRIAEVAERLRAEARARVTPSAPSATPAAPAIRPLAHAEAAAPKPIAAPPVMPAPIAAPTPAVMPAAAKPVAAMPPAIPAAAAAAPAMPQAAPLPQPAQALRSEIAPPPVQTRPAVPFAPPSAPVPVEDLAPAPFIPPQPERALRPTRMPRVEDLPLPAQNQLRATRGEGEAVGHDPKRMTLLQRLATVGFGRKDESPAPQPAEKPAAHRPPGEGPQRPSMSPAHAEYTKRPPAPHGQRPAQGALDSHGRPAAPARGLDDEHLEIPAFLRRQTN
jgi:cell division protein FtsZ